MDSGKIKRTGKLRISINAFALLSAVAFCHYTIFEYIEIIIGKLPVVSFAQCFFFPVLYFALIIGSYNKRIIKYLRITDIGIIVFFTLAILLTVIIYPQNEQYILDSLFSNILPCAPFLLLGICFVMDDKTINTVSKFSCLAIIISTIYVFYYMSTGRSVSSYGSAGYSMYWSYLLLPNTLITINYAFREKNVLAISCSIIGVLYAFSMGTRGVIVVLAIYMIISILTHTDFKNNRKKLLLLIALIIVVVFAVSQTYLQLLETFRVFLLNKGFSTRVIDYLLNGQLVSYTSGRTDIYEDLLKRLMERPFLGYGVYGEWPFGYYSAHNIYIEIMFHFGIPIGAMLMLIYITVFVKAIKRTQNRNAKDWIIMFGCLVFVKGIFGGRYMDYSVFFLLGLCLKEIRASRRKHFFTNNNVAMQYSRELG